MINVSIMSSQCQPKNFDTKTFCRLCFNIICYTNYEVIEEIAREVLEIVLPNLNLEEGHKHLMCKDCSSKLFAAFNFKSTCMDTEDIIFSHVSTDSKVSVIELKEVYLKTNGNIQLSDMWENQRICRLCFQLVTLEFVSLNEVDNSIIDTYIPQLNISATKDPVICRACYNSLCIHGTFLKNCLSAHELYKSADKQFYIKTEEIEIKLEDCHDERQDYEDIEKQSSITLETEIKADDENQDKDSHSLDGEIIKNKKKHISEDKEETDDEYMLDCEGIVRINKCELDVSSYKRPNLKFSSEIHMYKCGICNHEAKCKDHLKTHQLLHKDPSEIQKYRCDVCNYEFIYKRNLKSHQLIHKDHSEIQTYRCDACNYETRYKRNLKRHQLTHKDPSEIQMYRCDTCHYETIRKTDLKSHQLIHKDHSETQMYKCDTCPYETKRKDMLKSHLLLHKDPSEIQIYKCNKCIYQSRFKRYLKDHQLTHKDPSEIQMYKCDACDYLAKRKSDLKYHKLTHKDSSELRTYKCDLCNYETKFRSCLHTHKAKHKDPLQFQCYICNFVTRYKNHLKTHVFTHKESS